MITQRQKRCFMILHRSPFELTNALNSYKENKQIHDVTHKVRF